MSSKKLTLFPLQRCIAMLTLVLGASSLAAADLEMVDAFGNVTGVIDASRKGLLVSENSGAQFFYQRARQYDLPDGRYLGFFNQTLNRIIRFPRSGRGPVERADLDTIVPRFVPASVWVRPIGSGPGFGPYLPGWLGLPPLEPTPGYHFYSGTWLPSAPHFGYGGPGFGGWPYFGGYYHSGISVSVAAPAWSSAPLGSPLPMSEPQSRLIESRVVDEGRLPPVEMEFINAHNETLLVTLTDVRHPDKQPQYKIAPGGSQRVKLPRSAGQTRINRYQTWDDAGNPIEREVRVELDPEVRYEVAVDRMRIQSIAIDRTGKSPNEIEDINVQTVPVGGFSLPPDELLVSDTIDVFAAAQR